MKPCPMCQLINPETAEVCDCGYSFQSGGTMCPRCHSVEGLQLMGLADRGGRMAAGLLGGAAFRHLLYGTPVDAVRCKDCGHTFTVPRQGKATTTRLFVAALVVIIIVVCLAIAAAFPAGH